MMISKRYVVVPVLAMVLALISAQALAQTPSPERMEKFRQAAQQRVDAIDTNSDGAISKEEYLTHAESQFDKLDTDGDGKITEQEREQARESILNEWQKRRSGQ